MKKDGGTKPSPPSSLHAIENGALGVDYAVQGLTKDQVKDAASFTSFIRTDKEYDDKHLHSQLADTGSNRLQGYAKFLGLVLQYGALTYPADSNGKLDQRYINLRREVIEEAKKNGNQK